MLIFGDNRNLIFRENMLVYNLSSLLEGYERVDILPHFYITSLDRDFDIAYANYILNNDAKFIEFMKLIMPLYYGNDVYVMVSLGDEINDTIVESLQKLIQQRYGIVSNNIYEIDDWNYVNDSGFNFNGLYNLDIDKERYSLLTVNNIINNSR